MGITIQVRPESGAPWLSSEILITELLKNEQHREATAQGSRSTVLQPLAWLFAFLAMTLIGLIWLKAPVWLVIIFVALIIAVVLLYLWAYVYCIFRDREALRSESYLVQKLAIERGIVGDSMAGIFKPEDTEGAEIVRVSLESTTGEKEE